MIYVVIGTRAQLVKMAPVIRQIETRNWSITLLYTGQHQESMDDLIRDFQIQTRWHSLCQHPQEVKTILHALKWVLQLGSAIILNPVGLLPTGRPNPNDVLLVHGDTLSTLLGALLGKRLKIKVGHIEAGLRSFNLLNPFPEEIVRRITAYFSDIAFCPGEWATANLKNHKHLVKINTGSNTIADSLALALGEMVEPPVTESVYGVVSIHRFENIFPINTLRQIIEQVTLVATRYPLIFVLHPATRKQLIATGLMADLEKNNNIELRSRCGYIEFVRLLSSARFVITDGGSNQEELSLLNIPTLLMRKSTERQEGLGANVYLGGLSFSNLQKFLADLEASPASKVINGDIVNESPSAMICQHIAFAADH
ncbi:UDP-N-acetylglucosamine 2-epimerase [Methylomonas montana]|uniref:UDP-N-acetylglucosamine 2-epimerase n=1 Tax=Methylomonas montana TaxID=3058963 RepID=UPI002659180F|nr:UDP-N-acetylglucosamine 2-epimerase [Methylomonas montana]WKJ88637.1 UDP-N-acetylglucosamine 2-epimerase [Methylomonas montana]